VNFLEGHPEKKASGGSAPEASDAARKSITDTQTLPRLRPKSKKSLIVRYLVDGGSLTTLEAFLKFRVTALHSTVSELGKLHGVVCERKTVSSTDAEGRISRVQRYWITKGTPSWHAAKRLLEGVR
jgi:hypothetical protein